MAEPDDLHGLFKRSVPVAPSTDGWVQRVRRKRQLRAGVAGGVAALVVAVAVPMALTFGGRGETLVASPEPAPAPSVVPSMMVSMGESDAPAPSDVSRCPVVFEQGEIEVRAEDIDGGYACTARGGVQIRNMELRDSVAVQVAAEALADGVPVEGSAEDRNSTGGTSSGGEVSRTLVLRTEAGDELRLDQSGDGYEFSLGGELLLWVPPPEFAAELEALFSD